MNEIIIALVLETQRRQSSARRNPSYDVTLAVTTPGWPETVTLRTSPDAVIAYAINNKEYREIPHEYTISLSGQILYPHPADLD